MGVLDGGGTGAMTGCSLVAVGTGAMAAGCILVAVGTGVQELWLAVVLEL